MIEDRIIGGYYLMAREIDDSDLADSPPHTREVYHYLIRHAVIDTQTRGSYKLDRGQLLTTYADIREALSWKSGARTDRYTPSQIKKAMEQLRAKELIETQRTDGGVIITVIGYDFYQDPENYRTQSTKGPRQNHERTSERTTVEPTNEPAKGPTLNSKNVEASREVEFFKNTNEPANEPAKGPRTNQRKSNGRTTAEPVVYKDEEIERIVKNTSTPHTPQWGAWLEILKKSPRIQKIEQQLTQEEFDKILEKYDFEDLKEAADALENYKGATKYVSLYRTLLNGLKRHFIQKEEARVMEPMWKLYADHILKHTGITPVRDKKTERQIRDIGVALRGSSNEQTDDGLLKSWDAIFKNWDLLEPFYRKQIQASEIRKNLPNILKQIRDAKATKDKNQQSGRSDKSSEDRSPGRQSFDE